MPEGKLDLHKMIGMIYAMMKARKAYDEQLSRMGFSVDLAWLPLSDGFGTVMHPYLYEQQAPRAIGL